MPTFICFLNWTDQGAKNAKEANKRFQASKSMAEKLGGKLLTAYVTTGHYDVVLTLEMPNGEAMTKFASAIFGSGNARTTTVRAYTPDEFSKLAAEAPKMYGLAAATWSSWPLTPQQRGSSSHVSRERTYKAMQTTARNSLTYLRNSRPCALGAGGFSGTNSGGFIVGALR